MTAFTPRRVFLAMFAALALTACDNQQAAGNFKPVPVNPVIGDVPLGSDTAPVTVEEYQTSRTWPWGTS